MKKTALILAGGRGERFWPKSRKNFPKQFLSLTEDGKTMIQLTIERILPIVELEDIFVVTNKDYKQLVLNQFPKLPEDNILCEPMSRNTAPCIGLGAIHISLKYKDAIMIVLPSDHLIKYKNTFTSAIQDAAKIAEKDDNLITIGITPDYPETGYGYLRFNPNITEGKSFAVEHFVEKPSLDIAKEYLISGDYLWNSGMFLWKASSILKNICQYMPSVYNGLLTIKKVIQTPDYFRVLEKEYAAFISKSIDYGIMENAQHIFVFPCIMGWDDVGSWSAVTRIRKCNDSGNIVNGLVVTIDTKNCIIEGSKKLIATIGLENLIIVDTDDATLICDKNSSGDIKKILENLKICNRDEYI